MPVRHAFLALFAAFAFAAPTFGHAEGKSIIVLDASGSMWGQIDGRPKLEIARDALGTVLQGLPADTELGLMAYGHREKGSCDDIELIVPPAKGTSAAITAAAQNMKFLGKTPLSEAVRRAAGDLRSTEEKATVILITDGIETCNADPCALGAELEASGVDFTAHVVGFGLTADEGKQVACLAENTGGKYIQATDASSLVDALKTAVAAAPPPAPEPVPVPEPPKATTLEFNVTPKVYLVKGGPEVGEELGGSFEVYAIKSDGTRGELVRQAYSVEPAFIEPGTYKLVYDRDVAEVEIEAALTANAMFTAEFVLDAGIVTLRPVNEPGGEVPDQSSITMFAPGGDEYFNYGSDLRVIPAGEYEVEAKIGLSTARATVVVNAGESLTQDIVVSVGRAVIDVFYTADLKMEENGQAIDIVAAKVDVNGNRASVAGGYGAGQSYTLPPGDYVAIARKDEASAEQPFTVSPNAVIAVSVVLNAGVLAVAAPGARTIEILGAKVDINGNRKSVRSDYGEEVNVSIPAGDYVVVAERDGVLSEAPVSVVAGERSEVTVP